MSDAVVVTCPRCGAGIERVWNAMQAQCRYCGTLVELPRTAPGGVPHPAAPRPHVKTNYAATFIPAAVTALVVLITSGIAFWQSRSAVPAVAGGAAPFVPRGDEAVPISAANLKAVDPTSLIQQAAAAVRQRDAQCELTYAYIGEFAGAGFDTSGNGSLLRFTCHSVDKSKPPGQDVSDNEWQVRVSNGYFVLDKSTYGSRNTPPWQEPTCPFAQAWAAAVAGGLPPNAVADVHYGETSWTLDVTGHPEYRRTINGATCRVVP